MQKLNDLSRSLIPLEPDGTLIAAVKMNLLGWLVFDTEPGAIIRLTGPSPKT